MHLFGSEIKINIMTKTERELAFLRDLYVDSDWTQRFTNLVDKHLVFANEKNFLYINAGTGNHALVLSKKFGKDTKFFATCENKEILAIARDKSSATKAGIDFSMRRFDDETFESVLADASFARPAELPRLVAEAARVTETGGRVAFFTVAAGSFGEVFSFLWEVLFNADLGEHGAAAEQMISELPTVSQIEELAQSVGLKEVQAHVANETFEYENGQQFINSPLVADFLLPVWLKTLSDKEKKQAATELAKLIDTEDGTMSFRFSVKAVLITGTKG